ncbi:MAG: hypothetical protein IIU80_01355 [Clostridia bacterium]|nr:hypothetical protein [Clostridia bacterium]
MKKILAFMLSLVMMSMCCIYASAESNTETFELMSDSEASPRYTHLGAVSAGIKEKALGFVLCESTYACMHENYTFVLTCTLQRTDGSAAGWQTYKTTTETFLELGTNGITETWFAPAGYAYRTFTTIVIKNSRTGKVVETATCDSPVIYK